MILHRIILPNNTIRRHAGCFFLPVLQRQRQRQRRPYSTPTRPTPNKHGDEMRQFLQDAGALDVRHDRPISIRAEQLLRKEQQQQQHESSDNDDDNSSSSSSITKIIHFQRHGQAYHNLIYRILEDNGVPVKDVYHPDPAVNPFVRPELVDAPLTALGREQCVNQRDKIMMVASNNNNTSSLTMIKPELIIVSPLHRTLQTAQITFDNEFRKGIPFVAHDGCREELGLLTCNQSRRPLSETIREFPHVDFSSLLTNNNNNNNDENEIIDTLWSPDQRECPLAKSQRIYSFLVDYVRHLPQNELAVVSHSAWLFHMCNTVMDITTTTTSDDDDDDDEKLVSWFETAEIRSMKVTFSSLSSSSK